MVEAAEIIIISAKHSLAYISHLKEGVLRHNW